MEEANDNRFSFATHALLDHPTLENRMPEEELRLKDAEVANNKHEREIKNWIIHKVPCTIFFTKRELNLRPNEIRIDSHDNLWGEI